MQDQIANGVKSTALKYYTDYSIGFLTRGCFRHYPFCVNKNYNHVHVHSTLSEFYDSARSKICLLDDNFLGLSTWKELLSELQSTQRCFQFKQGLDERLLTEEKCKMLFQSKYDGDYIFAFDDIDDARLIEDKLKIIRCHTNKSLKFYLFCGYDRNNRWDLSFWQQDLIDLFERIRILISYHALPYVMRYARYEDSPYANLYIQIARWTNQPAFVKKKSFREFAKLREGGIGWRTMIRAEKDIPELTKYFDLKWR